MTEDQEARTSAEGVSAGTDAQIAFILGHPGMSEWLKGAIRTALTRDPVAVLNDLEILNLVLRSRSETLIRRRLMPEGAGAGQN